MIRANSHTAVLANVAVLISLQGEKEQVRQNINNELFLSRHVKTENTIQTGKETDMAITIVFTRQYLMSVTFIEVWPS